MKIQEILSEISLTKNKWELVITNADKLDVGNELVDLVSNAYSQTNLGSFIKSIPDVIPSDWEVIDWDDEPDIDAVVFFRSARPTEPWIGKKIQGIGHDSNPTSKKKAIQKIQSLLLQPGWWIESSDALRHTLRKLNANAITDEEVLRRLFNDPNLFMFDDITYIRKLVTGELISETVFGNPVIKD